MENDDAGNKKLDSIMYHSFWQISVALKHERKCCYKRHLQRNFANRNMNECKILEPSWYLQRVQQCRFS